MVQPGWYPDPDDPGARRYWDGANWSAPLPGSVDPDTPRNEDAGCKKCVDYPARGFDRCYEHLTAAERIEASRSDNPAALRVATGPAPACSVGPCGASRLPGSLYCAQHGPQPTRARTAKGPTRRPQVICPHCQTEGSVTAEPVKVKRGVSGGKLTGAILTGGISMLGTGLSRKESVTRMRCDRCRTTWIV